MQSPEKNTEGIFRSIIRTAITAAIIAIILIVTHVFRLYRVSKPAAFGVVWVVVYVIVYGGHWLELLFINKIKFVLPQNSGLIHLTRIAYWFLCAIPLFILANWVGNVLINNTLHLGQWWVFGLFYIGIELLMHAIMQLRIKKSFYNGVY